MKLTDFERDVLERAKVRNTITVEASGTEAVQLSGLRDRGCIGMQGVGPAYTVFIKPAGLAAVEAPYGLASDLKEVGKRSFPPLLASLLGAFLAVGVAGVIYYLGWSN